MIEMENKARVEKSGLFPRFFGDPTVLFLFVSVFGFVSLMWVTAPWGIGLVSDSIAYINAAETFFHGHGFLDIPQPDGHTPVFTRHGPLFSLVIAGVCFFTKGDGSAAAQEVQALLYAANIGVTQFLTYHYTRSVRAALFSGMLVLTSLVMLEIHSKALSEPIFIFLTLLGFFFLSCYLERSIGQTGYFSLSVIFLAAAILARYAGIAIAATVSVSFLIFGKSALIKRLILGVTTGALICVPMLIWVARNYTISRYVGVPSVKFEPYFVTSLWELGAFVSIWLLPLACPSKLRMLVLGVFAVLVSFEIRSIFCLEHRDRKLKNDYRHQPILLPWILSVFIVIHIGVHILSASFVDQNILDDRHLAPVNIALILILTMWTHRLWQHSCASRKWRILILGVAAFLSITYPLRYVEWVRQVRHSGIGYASPEWKNSQLIQKIKKLPERVPLYTNGMDIVYWMTKRPVRPIPDKIGWHNQPDSAPVGLNPEILKQMTEDIKDKQAVLAYFTTIYWRSYYPSAKELQSQIPLERFESAADGDLYRRASENIRGA